MPDVSRTMRLRESILSMFAPVCGARDRSSKARKYRRGSAIIVDNLFADLNARLGIETLLEFGAHEATASKRFMQAGGKRAIAVEANPAVYERKTLQAESFGVEVVNVGLADRQGTMDFFCPRAATFRGMRHSMTARGTR